MEGDCNRNQERRNRFLSPHRDLDFPMRMNVLTELRQPVGTVTTVDICDESLISEEVNVRGMQGSVILLRTGKGLLVDFSASGTVHQTCCRCLSESPTETRIAFNEEYIPFFDAVTGARVHSGFDSDALRISTDFILDLGEGVRQYLLMSEWAKPLCRPDCAGLCSHCGTDLNSEPCSCDANVAEESMRSSTSDRQEE